MKPTITTFLNHQQLSASLCQKVITHIEHYDSFFLGPATGFSPKLAYELIAKQLAVNPRLSSKIKMIQLDEWLGLSPKDEVSCYYRIKKQVVSAWNLDEEQCFFLDGNDKDQEIQLEKMKDNLRKKPMDLCILGLGKNGHIAFNEPGSSLDATCRIVDLSVTSKAKIMSQKPGVSVEKGITIGLKEILESKEVLLLVTGEEKEEAFQKLQNNTSIEEFPASALYTHPNWKCFVDLSSVS